MPFQGMAAYDIASQVTLAAVKARTDIIRQSVPYLRIPIGAGVVIQGTWSFVTDALQLLFDPGRHGNTAELWYCGSGAINDEYDLPFLSIPAGTYSLEVAYVTDPSFGIITVKFGAATIGTIDCYSAGTTRNLISVLSFVVAADTTASLKFIMATKNGLASAYKSEWSLLTLWRTA